MSRNFVFGFIQRSLQHTILGPPSQSFPGFLVSKEGGPLLKLWISNGTSKEQDHDINTSYILCDILQNFVTKTIWNNSGDTKYTNVIFITNEDSYKDKLIPLNFTET